MKKLKDLADSWALLLAFILITIFGFVFIYFGAHDDFIPKIYSALDTASAVALATLAFFGYKKYIQEQNQKKEYEKGLKDLNSRLIEGSELALLIQFGGNSDMIEPMKHFLDQKHFKGDVLISEMFGDENFKIDSKDIDNLIKYCQRIRPIISKTSKVHVLYGGMAIGGIVIADILSNSSDLYFYHKNGSTYEIWYHDIKSQQKSPKLIQPKL